MKRLSKISSTVAGPATASVFSFATTKADEEKSNKMDVESETTEFPKKNNSTDLSSSPSQQQRKLLKSTDTAASKPVTKTPTQAAKISKSTATPKIDRDARLLNIQLEQCLNMTLRKEGVTGSIVFMGTGEDENDLVNASNMIELICSRLSGNKSDILNAISYLYGCFKKILTKEATAVDKLREDLLQ